MMNMMHNFKSYLQGSSYSHNLLILQQAFPTTFFKIFFNVFSDNELRCFGESLFE